MWVESLIGVPHVHSLAVYPVLAAPSREGPFPWENALLDLPRYPIEREFPDLAEWFCDPGCVCALWMGDAFSWKSSVLAVTANLPAIEWPPIGSSVSQTMSVRGIGSIWIGTTKECQAIVDGWMNAARQMLQTGGCHEDDLDTIGKMVRFIEREARAVHEPARL